MKLLLAYREEIIKWFLDERLANHNQFLVNLRLQYALGKTVAIHFHPSHPSKRNFFFNFGIFHSNLLHLRNVCFNSLYFSSEEQEKHILENRVFPSSLQMSVRITLLICCGPRPRKAHSGVQGNVKNWRGHFSYLKNAIFTCVSMTTVAMSMRPQTSVTFKSIFGARLSSFPFFFSFFKTKLIQLIFTYSF